MRFLLSDEADSREVSVLLECHLSREKRTRFVLIQGVFQGKWALGAQRMVGVANTGQNPRQSPGNLVAFDVPL
jgi:hypothetical protein